MIELEVVKRTHPDLLRMMSDHYSQPKGFVGRNICLSVKSQGVLYGFIVGGSATRFLPGRTTDAGLNRIINNVFFHTEKRDGVYPCRNFSERTLRLWESLIVGLWRDKYGDDAAMLESLVELPRTGECYRRAGWTEVGLTKGFTCKRVAGKGTDSWSGRRVWDTDNLRPKRVFIKPIT